MEKLTLMNYLTTAGVQYTKKGSSLWIRCPWHKNGQERTPSLVINVDKTDIPVGSFYCFGCSPTQKGGWKKLADRLGINSENHVPKISVPQEKFLSEDIERDHSNLLEFPIVPSHFFWRGIHGKILRPLKSRLVTLSYNREKLYLPIVQNKKWESGIYCSLDGSEPKYINEPQTETSKLLFPFDYVKKQKKNYVVLVEGPRDSLNLLQHGISALSNIGGITVWSSEKAELISQLDVDVIITAFDPDKIGADLTAKVKEDCKFLVRKIYKFKMRPETSKRPKEDPGNLSSARLRYLADKINEITNN